jgi:hypothetical protein
MSLPRPLLDSVLLLLVAPLSALLLCQLLLQVQNDRQQVGVDSVSASVLHTGCSKAAACYWVSNMTPPGKPIEHCTGIYCQGVVLDATRSARASSVLLMVM